MSVEGRGWGTRVGTDLVNWQQEEPEGLGGRRQPSGGGTSRMSREAQVRICERLGVQLPGPTRRRDCSSEFPAKGAGNPWQSRQSPEGSSSTLSTPLSAAWAKAWGASDRGKPGPHTFAVHQVRVLNGSLGARPAQRFPWGKPWDRQPVSGKLRRKLGVSPGFAAYRGPPPPKRLRIHQVIGFRSVLRLLDWRRKFR